MKRKKIIHFLANLLRLDVILIDKQNVQNTIKYHDHVANIEIVNSNFESFSSPRYEGYNDDIKRQAFMSMYKVLNEMGAIKVFSEEKQSHHPSSSFGNPPTDTVNTMELRVLVSKD